MSPHLAAVPTAGPLGRMWTQRELAAAIPCSPSFIRKAERARELRALRLSRQREREGRQ
jgi:hypothetical protein